MNKKGFGLIVALMFATVFFIFGMAIAPALKETTQEARDSALMNCSSTTNSQVKAVCTSIDITNLFVGIVFGIAGLVIARSL